jgi:hypothetical protein
MSGFTRGSSVVHLLMDLMRVIRNFGSLRAIKLNASLEMVC